jgi:hypothetical protein
MVVIFKILEDESAKIQIFSNLRKIKKIKVWDSSEKHEKVWESLNCFLTVSSPH